MYLDNFPPHRANYCIVDNYFLTSYTKIPFTLVDKIDSSLLEEASGFLQTFPDFLTDLERNSDFPQAFLYFSTDTERYSVFPLCLQL